MLERLVFLFLVETVSLNSVQTDETIGVLLRAATWVCDGMALSLLVFQFYFIYWAYVGILCTWFYLIIYYFVSNNFPVVIYFFYWLLFYVPISLFCLISVIYNDCNMCFLIWALHLFDYSGLLWRLIESQLIVLSLVLRNSYLSLYYIILLYYIR